MIKNSGSIIKIVLASRSRHRAELLRNAGLEFSQQSSQIDERHVEAPLLKADLDPADIAQILAEAKAQDISARNPDKLVIGCDQTLSQEGEMFHKPADMKAARHHLLSISGKTHQLNSAIVLVLNGKSIWQYVDVADMHVRNLSPGFIGRYLAKAGDEVLSSVGAYQIEGPGIQLFERIDGDYFTIIGLPILPLLAKLRDMGVIDG